MTRSNFIRAHRFSVLKKRAICDEVVAGAGHNATARKYGCSPSTLRGWLTTAPWTRISERESRRRKTCHNGKTSQYQDMEQRLYHWIIQKRSEGLPVSSRLVILQALREDPTMFDNARLLNFDRLWNWAHRFMVKNELVLRRATRTGQRLVAHADATKTEYTRAFNDTIRDEPMNMRLLVNMDETALFFEPQQNISIHTIGEKTIHIRSSGSNNKRITVCLAVSAHGDKLPVLVVFKGKPGRDGRLNPVERRLQQMPKPNGWVLVVQEKGWIDERLMNIWVEQIWRPYIERLGGQRSILLLDEFRCHTQPQVADQCAELGTMIKVIPGGYTSVLQVVDVGINKPFKDRFKSLFQEWQLENYDANNAVVPEPSRMEILQWVEASWNGISGESILNTYQHVGLAHASSLEEGAETVFP